MSTLTLLLRFALEVAGVVAVAYWGSQTVDGPTRWVVAIAAPALLIGLWAFVIAPGASNPIPPLARVLLGSLVLLVAAGALYVAGAETLALVYAALVVLDAILLLVVR